MLALLDLIELLILLMTKQMNDKCAEIIRIGRKFIFLWNSKHKIEIQLVKNAYKLLSTSKYL